MIGNRYGNRVGSYDWWQHQLHPRDEEVNT